MHRTTRIRRFRLNATSLTRRARIGILRARHAWTVLAVAGLIFGPCSSVAFAESSRESIDTGRLHVVGSFDDFNEVLRGMAVRDEAGWGTVTLDGRVTDIECTGRGALVFKPESGQCAGSQGVARIRCSDGRIVDIETHWSSCSRAVSMGFDQHGNKLTFIAGHPKELTDKLFLAELEAAAKRPPLKVSPTETRKSRGYATGTGFFVSADGHLLTSQALVVGSKEISVVVPGDPPRPAKLVSSDDVAHVALLKIDATATPLEMLSSHGLAPEAKVVTVGFPLVAIERQPARSSFGEVTAVEGVAGDARFVQMKLGVLAGNWGGPVIDSTGRVAGIVVAAGTPALAAAGKGIVGHNTGYAVKSDHLLPILDGAGIKPVPAGAGTPDRESTAIAEESKSSVVLVIAR